MKATLITGASGGIGAALASKLAEKKHNLLLVSRNAERLAEQCKLLADKFGVHAEYITADLARPGAAEQVFSETQQRDIEIEMLVNNAGIGSGGEFSELLLQSELDMLQLNISSLVALTHLVLPQMRQRKQGTILNVASMASFIPIPYMATYAASKVFVRSFTQALTQECKPYDIHVMLLCPGLTKTNFNHAAGLVGNEKGKGLNVEYSSSTQTAEEVADEAMKALARQRHVVVSGRLNRLAAKLTALLPNHLIAAGFARSYRMKTGK